MTATLTVKEAKGILANQTLLDGLAMMGQIMPGMAGTLAAVNGVRAKMEEAPDDAILAVTYGDGNWELRADGVKVAEGVA